MTHDEAQQKINQAENYLDHANEEMQVGQEMSLAVGAGLIAAAQSMLTLAQALKESDSEIDAWSKDLHVKIPTQSDLLVYVSGLNGRAIIKDNTAEVWVLVGDDSETNVQDVFGNGTNSAIWVSKMTSAQYPFTILDGMDMVTAAERLASDGRGYVV